MTLEEIVNNLKSAGQDYGQLFNNNPRMDNFASVLQQGLGQLIPSNADFKSPEAMRDWGTAAALNAPLGLGIKNPNLNAGLLDKHLSGQPLSYDELIKYDKNGLKMETPQLQRYNLANARAQLPDDLQRQAESNVMSDWNHGTERMDRLLSKPGLDPKRATSGPMAFGTDSKEISSGYAMSKRDTSLDDSIDASNYFTVTPKQLGERGINPISVERSFNWLTPEQKATIRANATRIGYENPGEQTGPFTLHPEGTDPSLSGKSHFDYVMSTSAKNNPLTALREIWHDGGELINNPGDLAEIFNKAGYPHDISTANSPWANYPGVLTGKAMITKPLDTSSHDYLLNDLVPNLEKAFKYDKSRKVEYGADAWDKNHRFTPKEWVSQLKEDAVKKQNSYVWSSIPDKVTEQLKQNGFNGILDTGGKGGGTGHQVVIPFRPDQVRSRFAAFDPLRKNSSSLLASGLLGSLLLKQMNQESSQQ